MNGSIQKYGCICKKKRCTCGKTRYRYVVDVGINPATGRRKQEKKGGFLTRDEAQTACNAVIYELNHGTYIKESSTLFKDFAGDWLKTYQKTHNVKVSTVRVRRHEISLLMPYFKYLKIKDITKKKYQDALNDLKDKKYSDNTLSGVHSTGRMIFAKAVEWDMIKKDPTQFAKVPRTRKTVKELEENKELPKYLEKEELAAFLRTAKEKGLDRDYIIFRTLAYTGLRAGELCALKWKDIHFKEGAISITKTYYNPTNNAEKYELLTPKTAKSQRVIEVDRAVLSDLERYKVEQKSVKMRFRPTYHDEDFVFAKTKKHPGYPETIKKIEIRMTRLLKLAKLNETLTPHSLRHTHTSLLAEAGVGLPEIMDRLGHTDDDTTKRIYLHVTKTMKKEASQKFSELMRSLLSEN
ncbi:tyrosine-type recombinase/integrase [Pelotomaculum propionicicum]|uniref:Tyrosine recombinase XerD n=1 Tax=Pelotomaculum propionicicum TaxID=258475 RepID=A0A4Y7RWY4_9FIRM|nr:tyrosine-type recombinase/integrase [Pelotomaculum propionicicum]TEB13421.1 Tyrosine recombinase XerD [Pelotomaculum propionicicum]